MRHTYLRSALFLTLACAPVFGQIAVKGEDAEFDLGFAGQFWADWTQDATGSQGYQQNLYLRRARIIVGGAIFKDVTFFFETDDPKLGMTPKALGSGFMVQDAFVEWKATNAFRLDAGLMIVPMSRNAIQSPMSYYTLDVSPLTTVTNTSTQSSALRDAGFAAKGFFLKDRLQYRLGAFAGERDSNAHDSLRTAGYLQYDFFDREPGYTMIGTALGKKKILAIDGGFDQQGSYNGRSGNVALDLPVHQGDEIGGQFQYLRYDGGDKFLTIADQNDYLVEAAYYVHQLKTQPFLKAESQNFVTATNFGKDINRYGFGINHYVHGQNLKLTVQYLRVLPQNSPIKPTNEFSAQLQVFYF